MKSRLESKWNAFRRRVIENLINPSPQTVACGREWFMAGVAFGQRRAFDKAAPLIPVAERVKMMRELRTMDERGLDRKKHEMKGSSE